MDTISEFAARRRKVLRTAGPLVLVGMAGALLAIFFAKDPGIAQPQRFMLLLVAGALLACIIFGARIVVRHYRCPACGKVPASRRGILFGLRKCPGCGALLK